MTDVDHLEHLAVLHLEPGDVLVLTYPDDITVETAERIREQVREALPDWDDVLVLSGGLEIGAVRGASK